MNAIKLLNQQESGKAKHYSFYEHKIDDVIKMKPGWDPDTARFNAWKHTYTNYSKNITIIHRSDISAIVSRQLITKLYQELAKLVPEKHKSSAQAMYEKAIKEFNEKCAA